MIETKTESMEREIEQTKKNAVLHDKEVIHIAQHSTAPYGTVLNYNTPHNIKYHHTQLFFTLYKPPTERFQKRIRHCPWKRVQN